MGTQSAISVSPSTVHRAQFDYEVVLRPCSQYNEITPED